MTKLLTFLLALLGALVIIVLSVDNRDIVDIVFWPLPFTYQMPLYAVFLIGLVAGRPARRHGHLALGALGAARGARAPPQGARRRVPGAS